MKSQGKNFIEVRPTSHDDVREYHVPGEEISQVSYIAFWHPMWGTEPEFDVLGSKGKEIATQLMSERHEKSISRIVFRPDSVRVYKTPTADWATVEKNLVIPTLKEALGTDFQPVPFGTAKYRELSLAGTNA